MKTLAVASSIVALATLATAVHAQCPPLGPPSTDKLEVPGLGLVSGDQLGYSVSIDGDVAVVGAWLQDLFVSGDNVGAAYVYEREQGCWVLKAQLLNPVGAEFGRAVAVSGDRILIGNWKEFDSIMGVIGPGTAYIYEKDSSGCWGVTAKLKPDPGQGYPWSFFGASVSLDGDRALIGAREDSDAGSAEGAAYVFELDGASNKWSQTAKIVPPFIGGLLPNWFGNSVSLSGERALIGAWVTTCDPLAAYCSTCFSFNCADTCACDGGKAFVYDLSPTTGQWTLSATLVPNDAFPGDGYGAVALSGDIAVVGAYEEDDGCVGSPFDCESGAAYVFERDQFGSWNETAKLIPSDAESKDNFGYSVAVGGTTIVVGARQWDGAIAQDVGSAYVFTRQGTTWNEVHRLTAPGARPGARVGYSTSVSKDGRYALLGAPGDNGTSLGTGAAYVMGTSLAADLDTASLTTGDVVNLSLWAGQEPGHENQLYVMLGSVSGTCPGLPLDGEHLPLNFADEYFKYTVGNVNAPPLSNSFGNLDAAGQAAATFTVPAGLSPSLAGIVFHHAYVTLDLVQIPGAAVVDFASNAAGFQLVP